MNQSRRQSGDEPRSSGPFPPTHPATWPPELLLRQCEVRRQRRSGPGGQHRNKVETAVAITHAPSGIQGVASERRSQAANLTQALQRLRVNLAVKLRTSVSLATEPSPLWRSRCRNGKLAVSCDHADFPAALAEALDWLQAGEFDVAAIAPRLGCTATQLVRFLAQEPEGFLRLNAERRQRGLREYR